MSQPSRNGRHTGARRKGTGPAPGRTKRRKPRRSWPMRLVVWGGSLAIWAAIGMTAVLAWYAYDLPEVADLGAVTRKPAVTLIAADGTLLASYGDVYGDAVTVRDLPPHLPQAVLAVEDRRFYGHFGIDPIGLARAMVANARAGRIVEGGSTITQQLAKNLFLSPERTIKRKVQEMLLAFWLEHKFNKDQILSLYLNRVYLGAGTYGVDAAARRYFGKPARSVNLYEAALLAGLLKAPSRYSPASDAARSDERTALVLRSMTEAGFVTAAQAGKALAEKTRGRAAAGSQARYFADWVMGQVADFVGTVDRDMTVITTLNPYHQRVAEEELALTLNTDGVNRGVTQGALVLMQPDGAIRAMVGGRDYDASQFNRATQALRQPGSAFKAFVYLAALEAGHAPDERVVDGPIKIGKWEPSNYGEKFYGEVTLREAFARSLNSVAVRLNEDVGSERTAAAARRLGITADLTLHPSLALGASEVTLLELTGAYGTFANKGHGILPYAIEEIRGPKGDLLYRRQGGGPGRVVEPREVNLMNNLMTATVAWGSGKGANPGRPAAGKTGTSQDFRDAWFIGFTADFVGGVWLGNDDGTPTKGVTGGSLPAQLWKRVMVRALEGVPPRDLPGGDAVVAENTSTVFDGDGGFIARILRSLGAAPREELGTGAAPASNQKSPSQQGAKPSGQRRHDP
jgi:penicillin-binding protein 1A